MNHYHATAVDFQTELQRRTAEVHVGSDPDSPIAADRIVFVASDSDSDVSLTLTVEEARALVLHLTKAIEAAQGNRPAIA